MVVFVILHYKTMKDTLKCIKSIHHLHGNFKIVVVDNGSKIQKDIEILETMDIDLIVNDDNLGFAKGNNVGCEYAINKYQPDHLCVLNSDIEILQEDFIDTIIKLNSRFSFDVLGPKILPLEMDSVNPFPVYSTLEQVQKQIVYAKRVLKVYSNPLLRLFYQTYSYIKGLLCKKRPLENGDALQTNVALHGCALIFSKKYYDKFKDVFYPNTFLFHEEEFLYYRCVHNHLTFLYDPSLELIHHEGQSINKAFGSSTKKMLFRYTEILRSLRILEEVMKEGKDI